MNKEMVTIAVITFIVVLGVHILNSSPETQDGFSEHEVQTFEEKRVFEDPPQTILTELNTEDIVREYLKNNVALSSFGDEVFCSFEVIGHDMDNAKLNAYLWVLCSELYVSDGKIKEGAEVSEPVLVVCEEDEDGYKIVKHAVPTNGADYAKSIADIFSPEYIKEMVPEQLGMEKFNERTAKLSAWNHKQAKYLYAIE